MAKIKKIQGYEKKGAAQSLVPAVEMETVKELLQTHAVRIPEKWVEIMGSLASNLSIVRGKKIRPSDIIREAIFQYCVKKAMGDERKTILRGSEVSEDQEVGNG